MAFTLRVVSATNQEANNTGASPVTATLSNTPVTGNLVIVTIKQNSATALTSVQDGNGVNLTLIISETDSTTVGTYIYAYIVPATPSAAFTVTLSGKTIYVNAYEFTGNFAATNGTASTFYDNGRTAVLNGAATSGTLTIGQGLITNNMVLTAVGLTTTITSGLALSGGLSLLQANTSSTTAELVDGNDILTTIASVSPKIAWTASHTFAMAGALFAPAPIGGWTFYPTANSGASSNTGFQVFNSYLSSSPQSGSSITFTSNTIAGGSSYLFIQIAQASGTPTVTGVSDTDGNTYIQVGTAQTLTGGTSGVTTNCYVYYCAVTKNSDTPTVIVSFLATSPSVGAVQTWYKVPGYLDNYSFAINPATSTSIATPSISTTGSNEMFMGAFFVQPNMGSITNSAFSGTAQNTVNNFGINGGPSGLTQSIEIENILSQGAQSGVQFTGTSGLAPSVSFIACFIEGVPVVVSDTTITSESATVSITGGSTTDSISTSDTTVTSENISLFSPDSDPVISDTTVTSENVMLNPQYNISVSDTTVTSENIQLETDCYITTSDMIVTSELMTMDGINVSDTTTISNLVTITADEDPRALDATTTSENVVLLIPTLYLVASDTTITSENVNLFYVINLAVSDTTVTSEHIQLEVDCFIFASDTTTTSENVVLARGFGGSILVRDVTVTSEFIDILRNGSRDLSVRDLTVTSENVQLIAPVVLADIINFTMIVPAGIGFTVSIPAAISIDMVIV